jgi:hypothetical protein
MLRRRRCLRPSAASCPQLLPQACEVFGGCLGLRIQHSPAAAGTTWCDEAYVLTVFDEEAQPAGSTSSSSRSSRHSGKAAATETGPPPLGSVWLLLDASYDGLPVTHLVLPGGNAPAAAGGGAASQAVVVAIVLPRSFCSSIRLGSGGGGDGASAASVLRGVLHEFGHALHFLLSTAAAGGATVAGPWASLELCEVAAHLTECLTRDATCLQALLRHRDTQQAPPPALIQQLLAYERVSNRGVQQWQQHVIAALLDATMAAGSGEQPGEGGAVSSCWRRLQELQAQHDPLPGSCQGSVALLEYLPALAVMQPGDQYCYVFADLLAAALWATYLTPDPLNPEAWQQLRRGLFEAKASEGTAAVVERLCGPGSMRSLSVWDERTGEVVTGWVPDLTAQAFVDIDLWS